MKHYRQASSSEEENKREVKKERQEKNKREEKNEREVTVKKEREYSGNGQMKNSSILIHQSHSMPELYGMHSRAAYNRNVGKNMTDNDHNDTNENARNKLMARWHSDGDFWDAIMQIDTEDKKH